MSGFASVLTDYVLNSLWQAPLLFAAAWVAARLMRAAGSAAEHRVWVGALLLESVLPAVSIFPWQRIHIAWRWHALVASPVDAQVAVQVGPGSGFAALRVPPLLITALSVAYVLLTVFFMARLMWQCARLWVLMRGTEPLELTGEDALLRARWSSRFGINRPISLVSSREIFSPVTLGVARKYVVLPAGMMNRMRDRDLETAIAHEFAHIRRNDFLKNLTYEVLALPVSYHPCLWLTRQRITETREMVCDEMAAGMSGNQEYAQSLLRLATLLLQGGPVRIPHAIGVFDANTLERRLMRLTEKKKEIGRLRLLVSLGACFALGVATATSAVALGFGAEQDSASSSDLSKSIPTSISPEKMQERVMTKVPPTYPPEAKSARIQGAVVLKAVIGKDGHVENLKVISGPSKLQQSALDAVRQWVYKPYLVNGAPVEVETKISVIYSLKK
ncbi:M56 family metallopeptidase [Telmatobacter sp. DSM 110680]|uniref:M56 family metallopeptidase n=1 Tax=Telmatobacter sp. DSM 110680 TaxID=3036704 RepID=A0AAU7DQ40_9BACT